MFKIYFGFSKAQIMLWYLEGLNLVPKPAPNILQIDYFDN